ncbi:class I SAM-dependent methyltransferase [Hyalangium rubrum]|uniref:Class I SAM-dependent methyltransferase n=1 Tax=Hyalangium rubrum TaxID=3103134 RepID=A0ABU5H3Z2_9BACT|nr:class I SAM-dependent methyltransferase [Hyalangium sp. s54d21]MDY7227842.1 class I SAM-dependent methyltransferase [Hyalangium sp. s54d21]
MGITMSPQDYATAFRLLASTARHHENIGRVVEERILPRLPKRPSLLDVGAGPGTVAQRIAPHFGSLTLLEPNRDQIAGLQLEGAKILHEPLERYASSEQYDLVLCSHVLYHVPLADWGGFIDRLLSFVRPGGYCLIVLGAARGPNYQLHRDFTQTVISSEQLLATLQQKRLPHEVVATVNGFSAKTFEEMYTLCRFFVLEDCYTPAQLSALSPDEVRRLDDKIRMHAERCRGADGVYRLEQDEDLVILPKS